MAETPVADDNKVPVSEKAWHAHLLAAEESEVEPHPQAGKRVTKGPQ